MMIPVDDRHHRRAGLDAWWPVPGLFTVSNTT